MKVQFEGALALVTGAGHGIGRATALALTAEGSRVLVVDLDGEAAEKVAAQCMEHGGEAHSYAVDVADRDAMTDLAATVHADHGPVDVLVNNAGVGMSARFADMSAEDWDWIVGVNLHGVINGCAVFGPAMVARGRGHVVNVSSGLAYTPRASEPAYITTKAAVLALSRSLRADWARHGVGVTALCPGITNTGIIDRTRFRGDRAEPDSVDRVERVFRRGHSPAGVAKGIVRAVERNRGVAPVSWESKLGWWFSRFGPIWAQERFAQKETL